MPLRVGRRLGTWRRISPISNQSAQDWLNSGSSACCINYLWYTTLYEINATQIGPQKIAPQPLSVGGRFWALHHLRFPIKIPKRQSLPLNLSCCINYLWYLPLHFMYVIVNIDIHTCHSLRSRKAKNLQLSVIWNGTRQEDTCLISLED